MTGDEFRRRRASLGFKKRKDIADEIGVSIDTAKDWELDRRPVPRYAVRSLERLEKTKGQRG